MGNNQNNPPHGSKGPRCHGNCPAPGTAGRGRGDGLQQVREQDSGSAPDLVRRQRPRLTIMQAAEAIERRIRDGMTFAKICSSLDVHPEFVRSVLASMKQRARKARGEP
jgi:signal transduction histidine kinase